jgi:hypothetical protein
MRYPDSPGVSAARAAALTGQAIWDRLRSRYSAGHLWDRGANKRHSEWLLIPIPRSVIRRSALYREELPGTGDALELVLTFVLETKV